MCENKIIKAARGWIGTRFQHQGRMKRSESSLGGVDCGGLILGVGHELRLFDLNVNEYPRRPDQDWLKRLCCQYLQPVPLNDTRLGDVLLLKWGSSAAHLGILSAYNGIPTLIHAHAQSRKVVEQTLDAGWQEKIVAAYRYFV